MSVVITGALRLVINQRLAPGTPPAQTVAAGIGRPATKAHEAVQSTASIKESR